MKGNVLLKGTLVLVMLAAMVSVPGAARGADLASAFTHPGGVQFVANVGHDGAILTINGNGFTVTREFGQGRIPAVDLFDANGYLLPDGNYRWQLQLLPGKADAERLRASAAKNGGRAPDAWRALSGSFAIRGGSVASPELVEAEAPRASGESSLGADLAAAPSRARPAAGDSDNAVRFGAVESRAPSADAAQAAPGEAAHFDADGGSALEYAARAPESTTIRRQPTSADGSNGRPVGSQPNR